MDDLLFSSVNNITVYVEHVGETGVSAASSTLYVGNATSNTEYGSLVLSTFEGDSNVLESSQGLAVTGEVFNQASKTAVSEKAPSDAKAEAC